MPRHSILIASLIPLSVLLGACTVTTQPAPAAYTTTSGTVYADDEPAPVNIETYPSVVYEGQPAYFYHDHWYHRDGGRYVSYRQAQEPPELHRQRSYIQAAPPAHVEERREDEHREERR